MLLNYANIWIWISFNMAKDSFMSIMEAKWQELQHYVSL